MIKTSRQSPAALLLLLIIGLFFTFSSVFGKVLAATTDTIAFQSKLVNSDGTNITNNTYNFRFRIYDASTSGTLLWSEDQALVVTDGVVSAQLGSVTPITSTVFAEPDVYLQVCFDANGTTGDSSNTNCDTVTHRYEEVFSTRKPITAVPVALGAKYLLDGSGNALGHNSFFKQGGNSFGSAGIVGTLDNYELKFYTNNTQKMVLTTSGKLGIGTVTPTAELEVAGNSGPVKLSTTLLGDPGTSTIFGKNVFRAQSTTTPSWTTAYDIDENYISSLLFDYENDILYVGTGGDGEIYRCPLSSDCDVAGDFTVVADPTDDPITDMVMSEASNLIFAVSGNRLYRCATSSNCDVGGDWTEVASGLDDTIEALVVDTTNNILYVGLGNTNGYILRCNITSTDCDAGSDFTLSFDSATASGFFSLVFDSSNGVLYAGSQSGTGFFRCEISTGCDASVDWTNPDAVTEDKVFDLIIDTENGVLYGTADDEIYRCDLSTNCDAAGDFTTSFDTPSVEVAVITYDPVHNRLFAGSYDSAIIYQCSTSTGCDEDSDWTTSVDVAEDSIEALEANKETGVVYAGTWTSALLLRFDDTSSETYAEYAYVGAKAVDTAGGSEDGLLTLSTLVNGTATDTLNVTGGNVGIGTVAPNARLEVTATAGEQLRLAYTSGSVYTGFSVDSSGNLLVNNTGTKTTFADTIVSNTGISVLESTGATYFTTFIGGDQSADITYTLPTASSNGVLTNTGGVLSWGAGGGGGISQVGSMTSSTVFGDATADDDWLGLGASAGRIAFDDQTVDYVNILNANVGIGTTAPAAMLDIQGVATEAVLGGEYITATADRDFSSDTGNWTGTNWSVTGGELIHTAGANVVTLQNSALTAAPAANDIIQLIFAANTTTAGVVTVNIGGSVQQIEFGRAVENRVYTATFVAVNSTVLTITPDSSWEGTIDDVSVKLFTMSDVTQYLRNADGTVGLELRSGGTGSLSNFIGSEAGRLNTTGDRNLAVGIQALYSNTTGARNTAIGYQSLRRTTIGIGNTGLGAMTLRQNTIGYENTAIGEMTMYYNVSGYWNTAIGSNTLRESRTGFGNTALGGQALLNLITGNNNTATGTNSLYSLTSGDLNTVLGDNSGYSLVVGSQNILIGQSAASNLSSGSGNIIIGNDIEAVNSTGSNQLNIGNLIFGTNIDGVDSTISSGNIGIGVKTPGQKLSVAGSLGILETGASPQYYTIFQGGDQSGNITYTLPTSSSNGVLTNAGGVLSWGAGGGGGISQVGSMTASSVFADSSADGNWLGLGATAGRIEFDSDGIDRVNILHANVGIGTSTPYSLLDVAQNSQVTISATLLDNPESEYFANFAFRAQTSAPPQVWNEVYDAPSSLEDVSDFAYDPANGIVYATASGNYYSYIYRCDMTTDCDESSDWSQAYTPTPGDQMYAIEYSSSNGGELYASGYGGIVKCLISTDCDESSDWDLAFQGSDNTVAYLAIDPDNQVLYGTTTYGYGLVVRCDIAATDCDEQSDFSEPYDHPSSAETLGVGYDQFTEAMYFTAFGGDIIRCPTANGCESSGDYSIVANISAGNDEGGTYAIDTVNQVMYMGNGDSVFRCETSSGCDADEDFTLSLDMDETEGYYATRVIYDSTNGVLYAGSQESGYIYMCDIISSCDMGSDWQVSYDSPESTISGLGVTDTGVVFAGSYSGAKIYMNNDVALPEYATYANIASYAVDTTGGAESGALVFQTMKDGILSSTMELRGNFVGIGGGPETILDISGSGVQTEGELISELITAAEDRDFASDSGNWTGSNWTVSGGELVHSAGADEVLFDSSGFIIGEVLAGIYYQIEFTINTTTPGTLVASIGGSLDTIPVGTAGSLDGQVQVLLADDTSELKFIPNDTWEGSIDDVSVKLIAPNMAVQIIRNADGTIGMELRAGGTGTDSTLVGRGAGQVNVTGNSLSAFGVGALASNTTGDSNAAIGARALLHNTVGYSNTALGTDALNYNTTGSHNVAIGDSALFSSTYAFYNTAVGSQSNKDNTSGAENSSFGMQSLFKNTSGSNNTSIGMNTHYELLTGSWNTALGYNAGYNITSGSNNITLGVESGSNITTGDNNIVIGNYAEVFSGTESNQLNIGNYIYGTGFDGTGDTLSNAKLGIGKREPIRAFDVFGESRFTANGSKLLTGSIDPTASTSVTGTSTLFTTELDVGDMIIIDTEGTLTGSIDPIASTTVTGVGTQFLAELTVGDTITVSGETRTVVAIASATSLTVDTAFSDNGDDTAPLFGTVQTRTVMTISSDTALTVDKAFKDTDEDTSVLRYSAVSSYYGSTSTYGGATFIGLATPEAPTIAPQGTSGSTTWTYKIAAVNAHGNESVLSANGTTTSGNSDLNGTDFNRITWTAVTGAVSYTIYRTVVGTSPTTTGYIGRVLATQTLEFDDIGLAATGGYSSSVFNESSNVSIGTSASRPPKDTLSVDGRINQSWHYFFSDFLGSRGNVTANTTDIWEGLAFKEATACTMSWPSAVNGILRMATAAAIGNGCFLDMGDVTRFDASYNPVLETAVNINSATSVNIYSGLVQKTGAGTTLPTAGAWFQFDPTVASTWIVRTDMASTTTTVTNVTPSTTANVYDKLRIELTSTSAKFYINDVLVANHSANIPSGTILEYETAIFATAVSVRSADVDFVKLWQDDPIELTSPVEEGGQIPAVQFADTQYVSGASDIALDDSKLVSYVGMDRYDDGGKQEGVYALLDATPDLNRTVLGVSAGLKYEELEYNKQSNPYAVAVSGPATLWVEEGDGGNIEVGSELGISDTIPGVAMKNGQGVIVVSAENIDWSLVTDTFAGKKVKKILVTVVGARHTAQNQLESALNSVGGNYWNEVSDTAIQTPYKVVASSFAGTMADFNVLKTRTLNVNDLFTVDDSGGVFATALTVPTIKGVAGGVSIEISPEDVFSVKVGDQIAIEASVRGVKVNNLTVSNQQAGKVVIPAGQTEVTVSSTLAKTSSVVIVTPTKALVTAAQSNEGTFVIRIGAAQAEDVEVGWYIVNMSD